MPNPPYTTNFPMVNPPKPPSSVPPGYRNGPGAHNYPVPTPPARPNGGGVDGGLMGDLGNPQWQNGYAPASPAYAPPGAAAPQRIEGPYGNWFDPTDGPHGNWKDAWGNTIAHMNVTPGAGGPGTPAGMPRLPDPNTTPAAPVPGVPTPPQQTPQTFYAPTTGSPYLQLGGNFLSYMNDVDRARLVDTLRGAGFQDTGAYSTYGPSDFIRPPDFDEQDLGALAVNDNVRQWLRFFLGNLGYGVSYQLPGGYQPGSGLPTPPPWPQAAAPGLPAPTPDPYVP